MFIIFAAIGLTCVLLSATAFKEKDYVEVNVKPKENIFKSAKTIFKNKPFLFFFAGDLFTYVSMAFFQTAMLYYITMLLNVPETQSFLVMLSAIGVVLCLFRLIVKFIVKFSKNTKKRQCLL